MGKWCAPPPGRQPVQQRGHQQDESHEHVRALGMQRAPDPEIVQHARAESLIILTFDLDLGDVLALGVLDKPSVIIFRLADERLESVNQRLSAVLAERAADLDSGALIFVEDTRYRVRKLPIGRAENP